MNGISVEARPCPRRTHEAAPRVRLPRILLERMRKSATLILLLVCAVVQAQQAPGRGNALMYYRSEGQATAAGGLRSPFPENQPQVANVDSL